MRRLVVLAAVLLSACLAIQAADKQGKGKGKGAERRREQVQGFVPQERKIIVEYFRGGPSGLPPGLAKRVGDLPPGLEKQVRRNGQLPPGLQKRVTPFPTELSVKLTMLPSGCERAIIGHLAIVWNSRTQVVIDVMALAGQ
jgi:hypothetical protein